jgi:site-specific DNA-cytosine methylase
MTTVEIRHFHLFGAIGGGARGFKRAQPRVGNMKGVFRCIGSVDVDVAANHDFKRLVGVPATTLDLFDREQYVAFHGQQPPEGWREAGPDDIRRAAGYDRPHIVFLSAPCKGFSGLLSETKSLTEKYQALNRLTLRGVWLMLEAWADDPPELIIFENVPRIATRGRQLLDRICDLLRAYGYAVAETTHDCGEIGGLAQSRKRFLLVARHTEKVPPFLYEPDKKPLRAVGDVLGKMPLPGVACAGAMHRIPRLNWKTWVRLAFVEPGSDWRSLNKLAVEDGVLRDYLMVPVGIEGNGPYGVNRWEQPTGTIAGRTGPTNGNFAVADPRVDKSANWNHGQQYGVHGWDESAGAIPAQQWPNQGRFAVADPRLEPNDFHGFRIVRWEGSAGTVTGARAPGSSAQAVSDPRLNWNAGAHQAKLHLTDWEEPQPAVTSARGPYSGACAVADPRDQSGFAKYAVTPFGAPAGTVISGSTTGQGAFAVADPRPNMDRSKGDHYLTGGHYGVVPWVGTSYSVSGSACHDNGWWSVADPRPMPAPNDKLVATIRALDGTWHRPFTTLELAALQSLLDPEDSWVPWQLHGESDQAWRERIGNAVPSDAAQAIAEVMGETLLLAWSGETFLLSSRPIWVRPLAIAMSVQGAVA